MIVLIDNYDSFVYNLVHYIGELGADTVVHRNDAISVDAIAESPPRAIVISPGPCDPDRAGISLEVVRRLSGTVPILGVCLGHQAVGQAFGGRVVGAPVLMHGKVSAIHHGGTGLFDGLPQDFIGMRYHSLMVAREDLPGSLDITAESDDGVIMGLAHKAHPTWGVQFHPESIASEHGHKLIRNFLKLAGIVN